MKVFIRLFFVLSFIFFIGGIAYIYKDTLIHMYNERFAPYKNVKIDTVNAYYRNESYTFVQNTDNFIPSNKQDLINIYYTAINAGLDSFTFYCVDEYEGCIDEVQNIAKDQELLSDINNYVHPFNQFSHIETEFDSLGKVTLAIEKAYTTQDIELINTKVDVLFSQLTSSNKSNYDNIKSVHDYIINNSRYDSGRSDQGLETYKSNIAYGPLFEGMAVCGGYSDLMQLFLDKLGIKNFKVSSDKHVWNAVYYNETWLNLDLTWDDPVASDGGDYLEHNYFMINTDTLLTNDTTEHIFNEDHYPELRRY